MAFALLFLLAAGVRESVPIRGAVQTVMIYRPERSTGKPPVVFSSGDGGWRGFSIDVAQYLASRGHLVVGVNSQAYLSSLSAERPLEPEQVGRDYAEFLGLARARANASKVLVIGWSEGAGLSPLAAVDRQNQESLAGLLTLGLPELCELAWRLRDSIIFLTRRTPNEKTFNSKDYIGRAAPVPVVLIQSTHDEFVPGNRSRAVPPGGRAQAPGAGGGRQSPLFVQPRRALPPPERIHRLVPGPGALTRTYPAATPEP